MRGKNGEEGEENKREQKGDTNQHPVVTEREGGYGTDYPCVNGIPY